MSAHETALPICMQVKNELTTLDQTPASQSLARVVFDPECEAAINEQIKCVYGPVASRAEPLK